MTFVLFFLLAAAVIGGVMWFNWRQQKKREAALQAKAMELGLSFSPAKDYDLAGQLHFLERLQKGSNRYASCVFQGLYEGLNVMVFDYHYQVTTRTSKGSSTRHYYFNITLLTLPAYFPELTISPENFFDKIAGSLGFGDINFESAEFSRQFKVTSKDKKFAYDFCNAQMIDYLLAHPDQVLEVEGNTLAEIRQGQLKAEDVVYDLEHLLRIRSLMPNYLFSQ